jgi:hypothetical protein
MYVTRTSLEAHAEDEQEQKHELKVRADLEGDKAPAEDLTPAEANAKVGAVVRSKQ